MSRLQLITRVGLQKGPRASPISRLVRSRAGALTAVGAMCSGRLAGSAASRSFCALWHPFRAAFRAPVYGSTKPFVARVGAENAHVGCEEQALRLCGRLRARARGRRREEADDPLSTARAGVVQDEEPELRRRESEIEGIRRSSERRVDRRIKTPI
jgi:hypothetical protein